MILGRFKSWAKIHFKLLIGLVIVVIILIIGINFVVNQYEQSDERLINAKVSIISSYLIIKNNNSYEWNNIGLVLNEKYVTEFKTMYSGWSYFINIKDFADSNGNRFNISESKPMVLKIKGTIPKPGHYITNAPPFDTYVHTSFSTGSATINLK